MWAGGCCFRSVHGRSAGIQASPQTPKAWGKGHANEVGRLAPGLPGIVEGTDTVKFIPKGDIPADRLKYCTYSWIVCNVRPEKEDPIRVRITVGGNLINYPGDCGTPTADIYVNSKTVTQ